MYIRCTIGGRVGCFDFPAPVGAFCNAFVAAVPTRCCGRSFFLLLPSIRYRRSSGSTRHEYECHIVHVYMKLFYHLLFPSASSAPFWHTVIPDATVVSHTLLGCFGFLVDRERSSIYCFAWSKLAHCCCVHRFATNVSLRIFRYGRAHTWYHVCVYSQHVRSCICQTCNVYILRMGRSSVLL